MTFRQERFIISKDVRQHLPLPEVVSHRAFWLSKKTTTGVIYES